jgi:hypothetical protein
LWQAYARTVKANGHSFEDARTTWVKAKDAVKTPSEALAAADAAFPPVAAKAQSGVKATQSGVKAKAVIPTPQKAKAGKAKAGKAKVQVPAIVKPGTVPRPNPTPATTATVRSSPPSSGGRLPAMPRGDLTSSKVA